MFSKKMARVLPAIFVLLVVEMIVSNVMVTNEPGANSNGNSRGNEFNLPNIIAPSAITATNQYTGSGAPLTLQEWADSRNVTVSRSLIGAGTTTADLLLAEGWYGYKLYTNVYNLYDTDEWNQFAAMPFDGTSNVVNNVVWNFGRDAAGANVETGVDINTPDQCCNVNLHPANTTYGGNPASTFTANDNAYWQQLVAFPRGQITAMWVAWDYWKGTWDTVGFSGWEMTRTYASINGTYAYELSSPNMGASNQWNSVALQQVPQSIITALNTVGTPGTIQFRVGLRSTQSFQCTPRVNAYMRFRNVRLFIRAKCLPTQVNLRVAFNGVGGNGGAQNVIQNIGTTHGTGQLNFTATPQPWLAGASPLNIVSTFTTSAIVHFPADNLEIVQFDMYQVIYGRHWRDTQVDANALAIAGANFVAANNTNIDWITFFYDRPPQIASGTQDNYINYLFNGTKPSDWDIYQVLDSQPVDKTTNLTGRQSGNTIISMSRLYAGFYGFWTFSAHSPNYVQSMAVPTNLYEGQLLRINGSINPGLAAGYITSTRAELTIKFPNGTIWSSVNRNVLVGSGGSVQFPSITIPTSGANYVAGVYTAILTWNNSRSGLPLNETGSMVRTFTIRHRATLTSEFPSQVYYDNLNTQQALPIQLRYVDIGGSDITDATITFTNFNSQVQTFTHQNAYFNYITLLNCTNGPRGLNNIVINAISPAFEPKTINIGVEIVRTANFTIDQYPSVSTQWNDNFFLTLHYTDALNGSGINIDSPNNITVAWPQVAGRYSVDMSQRVNGIYTLTFNTSGTMPDQLYSVPISIKKIGCQGRSIIMDISVTPRSTSLNLVPIPDVAYGDSMIVNSNFKAISSGALITGATATARIVETATVCAVATFPNGTYRFSLDTWSLPSLGTYTLNVTIWWSGVPYYANQTRTLTFNVIQRTTQAYASGTFDIKYWNSNFTVLLYYIDVLNSSSIRGSNVHITISAWDGVNPLSQVNTLTSITYNGTTGPWLLTFNASHFGRTNMAPGFRVDIAITWTASTKPYYVDRSVTFTIKVDEAPTFIYIKDPSRQTVPTGSNHTITFNLINQRSGTGISGQQGNIVVTSSGILPDNEVFNPAIGITFPNNNGSYVLMFNISKLAGDYVSFNISITMSNYVDIVNYAFTLIKISPVPITEIIGVDQVYLGQQMNMTIFFHLVGLLTGIPGAAVSVQDGPSSGVWAGGTFSYLYDGSQYYNITFTPSFSHAHVNQARSYSVFVNFTSSSGNSQVRVNFVVNPIPTNITNVYFNGIDRTGSLPTFSLYLGDSVNVSVYFHNLFNSTAVSGASVILTRAGYSGTLVRTGATYSLFVNTNLFGVGPFEFTVSATRNSFQQASQKIKLDIQAVSTNATIYLNGTQNNSMILYYGQNIRIGFIYRDTHNNVPLISPSVSRTLTGGATVVSGSSFVLNGNTWEVVLNTAAIGSPGTYFMTITAGLANYQTALATFTITINDIQTSLVVCNDQGNSQTSYSLYWGRSLSIALLYRSLVTGLNITGATMTRTGLLANSSFSVNGNWYNYTFNTATVVPNVYTISISASMANRTSPTVQITVSVLAITTTLEVYNGTTPTTSFMQYYRENVTIRLRLFDTVNSLPVLGVTFITAYGYIVSAGGGYYDLTVNSTFGGGIGIAQFTVTGQRANYVSSSEVITINVLSIPTSYRVFINGTDRTATLQETINFLESFDITIYYNDTFRTRPITGATITLTITNGTGTYGFALGASSPGNYSRVFDSSVLGAVIGNQYIFELSSSKANYISLFARINVFYNPIPTALNITYNSSRLTRSGVGNTITAIYSDEIALVVNLTSYLQGFNLTGAGVSILAVVNQQTIVGSYVMASHSYVITIRVNNTIYAMAAGFTHQILVVGDASGYKGDTFSLLVDVRPIPTNMSVTINGTNLVTFLATSIFLKNTLSINVYYERFYNGYEALSQIGGQATITFLNDISLTQVTITMTPVLLDNYFTYDLPLDLSMFLSGIKDFYITASLANYQTQQLKFSLNINKVNTTVSVLVNGMTQTQLGGETITLKDTIHFSVAFLETDTLAPVLGSTVEIRYGNDTNNAMVTVLLAYNASSGTYTTGTSGLVLDLKTFFAQLKIFTITAQRSSYEVRTTSFVVNIQKILVETRLVINNTVTTNLTLATNPRESFEFRVSLIDTFTGLPFLDLSQVTVSVTPQFTGVEVVMIAETIAGNYTGEFYVLLTAPTTPGAYMMLVKVNVTNPVLQQQYQFQVFKSEFSLVVLAPPEVPLWLVYALIAGIIALAVVFILYQVRFKYPPMIRKIMDLRRSVANARDASKLRPPKVLSREENIYNHYAGIINVYRFLATKDTRFATKAPGYAPTPEGAPELEWEIPPLEGAEMPTVAPKALKKAGMKGYVPTETIKPAAMPFVTPAAVTPPQAPVAKPMAVPVPTAAPAVKPVAPAVPGAKPAIAPPIAPPTPIAAPVAKPAPVVPTPPTKPVVKAPPSLQALPKPSVAPLKAVRPTTAPKPAAAPAAEGAAGETHENLYQQLVLLEQKRYKAERSLRDLEAKHAKGLISNEEFTSYQEKLAGGLEKIKTQIADIRRKLISF